jgi:hypothetical protein
MTSTMNSLNLDAEERIGNPGGESKVGESWVNQAVEEQ